VHTILLLISLCMRIICLQNVIGGDWFSLLDAVDGTYIL